MTIRKSEKRFIDIARQRLPISSRLNVYDILRDSQTNEYFLNIFRCYEFIDEVKNNNVYFDIYYTEDTDWWDNISYKYYETEVLWYLICLINDITNPFEEMVAGRQVKVLKKTFLYNIFRALSDISRL